MTRRNTRPSGFTLLELLTVIAIIGILAGLLFPAIKSALLKAEIAKANQAVIGLTTAFKSYYTDYGKWPISDSTPGNSNQTYQLDVFMVSLLKGSNTTAVLTSFPTANYQGNPRAIIFQEFKKADVDASGNFTDPWGRPYKCRLDIAYANQIEDPFLPASSGTMINVGVLVWSDGPDGQEDTSGETSSKNKDNIMSWH